MDDGLEVKVVGAGVAGLTVAAELVEHGARVHVFDQGSIIGQTACSWYAGGMLAPYCERESAEQCVITLGQEAADWWQKRTATVAFTGSLVVAQARDTSELSRFSKRTTAFTWLDNKALAALEPDLENRFQKALFFSNEAHLNPRTAMKRLYGYLIDKGVLFSFGEDGHAASPAEVTIDATGLSAKSTLDDLRGVKGEMLIIKTSEVGLSRTVRVLHPRIPLYIVPRGGGYFMAGATMIESAERGRVTARSMIELLSAAYALHPAFGEAEIVEIGCDVRPAFPNNLPRIIHKNGVYYINGLYRHGFLLAPALARMTRALIMENKTPALFVNRDKAYETHSEWTHA